MNKKIFILLIVLFSLVSCSNDKKSNGSSIETFVDTTFLNGSRNISADEFYSKDGDYFVYYYSLICEPCNYLKEDIGNFINSHENVYTLCLQMMSDEDYYSFKEKDKKDNDELINEMLYKTAISETYLILTPTLYEINDNKLVNVYLGYKNIYEFIGA